MNLQKSLNSLCRVYQKSRICLFTGAGVSFTEAKYYRTPGWWDLLSETHTRIHPEWNKTQCRDQFKALQTEYPAAWNLATVLVREAGSQDKFLTIMRRVLVGRTGRDAKYKRLPRAYLDHARTLNAVIAFSSRLRAFRIHPCLEPNPKIRAILTLNYDWFLEGGATQKYNADPFKPIASLETEEVEGRLPVFHIHGYVPHGVRRKPKCPIILTEQSYRTAYRPHTFTSETLANYLGNYPTLFIGISFNDELFLQRLEAIAEKKNAPGHFALLNTYNVDKKLLHRLNTAGILPIIYRSHQQIPEILGKIYQSGLKPGDLNVKQERKTGIRKLSPSDYWDHLIFTKK